jgi:integrase
MTRRLISFSFPTRRPLARLPGAGTYLPPCRRGRMGGHGLGRRSLPPREVVDFRLVVPRPRPPYLNRFVSRHGRIMWAVRVGSGAQRRRVFLKSTYGTPEFQAEYEAALAAARENGRTENRATAGTVAWLVDRYREAAAWTSLSPATRRQRENILRPVLQNVGNVPTAEITKATIIAGRDRRAATPSQARHFLDTMRGVFRWALENGLVPIDPTQGVRDPVRPKTSGFAMWTEEHVDAYESRWPIGTRQRVWLDVLLYTGLRRGDAVQLGRQHVRDGVATIMTDKSGNTIEVAIPILPVLAATLKAGPVGDLVYIVGENGRPLTKESFGNLFRKACRAAGVPGSAHGLRKVAATRAANNGATVAELEAIFGWTGGRMASHYTRGADRRRLARRAMHKLST